jgi:hypothetical protein
VGRLFVRILIRKEYFCELCSKELRILKFRANLVSGKFSKSLRVDHFESSRIDIIFLIKVRILNGIKLLFQRK